MSELVADRIDWHFYRVGMFDDRCHDTGDGQHHCGRIQGHRTLHRCSCGSTWSEETSAVTVRRPPSRRRRRGADEP
jgi:hypothetical protein